MGIHDRDSTDFFNYIDSYASKLERDCNKIVKVRCPREPFKHKLTILNPLLRMNANADLVPKDDFPIQAQYQYFHTRSRPYKSRIVTFVKATTYEVKDYQRSGLGLSFDVVNDISVVVESNDNVGTKRKDLGILARTNLRNRGCFLGGTSYDRIELEKGKGSRKVNCYYYSDIKWEERLSYQHISRLPFITEPIFREVDISAQCKYDPNSEHDTCSSPLLVPQDKLINGIYEVKNVIGLGYMGSSWFQPENDIVSQFADTSLIHFLKNREIPIWAAICANSLERPIKDHELRFINDTFNALMTIRYKYPNCMTSLAFGIVSYFFGILEEANVLIMCEKCGAINRRRSNKEFCTVEHEGRDCKKSYKAKEYYAKNQSKLCNYYRHEMRDTRALKRKLKFEGSK